MRSWSDRLDRGSPQVKRTARRFGDIPEGAEMLVPTARQVDVFIRLIPEGQDMDVRALRTALAIENAANATCPVTMGFHLRTVSEAALEQLQRGAEISGITPFWRVLNATTPTTAKLSCGTGFVAERRRAEGLGE